MHYVYLLQSDVDHTWYIGETNNLRRRLWEHNHGTKAYTSRKAPWKLLYYEAYPTEQAAYERERKLKAHGKGLAELKRRILFS